MGLTEQSCTSCKGDVAALTPQEAQTKLAELPGWELVEHATKLSRSWKFKNWKQAFAFVTQISELAEAEKHHPDVTLGWGYCGVILQTHSIGGLQENDFIMAAKISALE